MNIVNALIGTVIIVAGAATLVGLGWLLERLFGNGGSGGSFIPKP